MRLSTIVDDLDLIDALTYAQIKPRPQQWIVDGLVPVGGITMMSAAAKCGKTYAALSLSMAVTQGTEWLGLPTNQMKVVYVDGEVGGEEMHRRVYSVARGIEGCDLSGNKLSITSKRIDMREEDSVRYLTECVKRVDAGLLVLDPISKVHFGGDADEVSAKLVLGAIDSIRRETGATVLLINHFSRAASRRKTAGDRYYGSVRYAADACSLIELDREKESGNVLLTQTDSRYSRPIEPITMEVSIGEEVTTFRPIEGEARDTLVSQKAEGVLLSLLEDRAEDDGDGYKWVKRCDLAEHIAEYGLSDKALERACKSAVTEGLIERTTFGREAAYRLMA